MAERPLLPSCRLSVVVPVRDEAETLPETLGALARQIDLRGRQLDPHLFEVIVLANNCADCSAAVARSAPRGDAAPPLHVIEVTLPPGRANVGVARRVAMDAAYARFARSGRLQGVIATTDGDTVAAPTWVAATLHEVADGAEAVGGRIEFGANQLAQLDDGARRFHLLDVGYRLAVAEIEGHLDPLAHDPFPRHHQHFNASFAVTAAAYARAGGVPEVPFLEDLAFYRALLRVDARIRHSPLVRVRTSARRQGRVGRGLSTQLGEWEIMWRRREKYLVESWPELEAKFRTRRLLRGIWRDACLDLAPDFWKIFALADELGVESRFLREEVLHRQTFGSLWERIEKEAGENLRARFPPAPVEEALRDLRWQLASLRALTPARRRQAGKSLPAVRADVARAAGAPGV